jgi:pimeloyl-ACP methyl ester carboxylesterase
MARCQNGQVRRVAALAPFVALMAAACPAAALKVRACRDEPAARCGTLSVPLDRTGKLKGRIPIRFAYFGKLRGQAPILALSGGPGQAGVSLLGDFAYSLRPATRGRRAVLVLDQRGTGSSGLLRCKALEKSDLLKAGREAGICAKRLGARRDYYFSDDTVADIDALREALRIPKLSIYGVSYGTKVATLYAQRHPDRVERLVLDSVVEPGGPDPLYGPTFLAIPRVLGALCANNACRPVTADVVADTAKLVALLAQSPLRGRYYAESGKARELAFGRNRLFATLLAGDFDPSLRAEYPTALRSALRGDSAPIVRLAHRAAQVEGGGTDPSFLSPTLYTATVCTEQTFPWEWQADPMARLQQARAGVDAVPDAALYPFDRQTAVDSDELNLCSRWPAVQRTPPLPPPGPVPNLPALLVSGRDDLRTPLEGATKLAGLMPRSTLLAVPRVGHSVFGSDLSGCADRALASFFAGKKVQTTCKPPRSTIRPDGPIPSSLGELRAAVARGKRGQTVAAAARTVFDVLEQAADSLLTDPFGLIHGGGLRGGTYHETRTTISLHNVVYVPGVRVSGSVSEGGAAVLAISGRAAAHGTLRLAHGRATGVLDGQRINGRIGSFSRPSAARVARLGRHRPR